LMRGLPCGRASGSSGSSNALNVCAIRRHDSRPSATPRYALSSVPRWFHGRHDDPGGAEPDCLSSGGLAAPSPNGNREAVDRDDEPRCRRHPPRLSSRAAWQRHGLNRRFESCRARWDGRGSTQRFLLCRGVGGRPGRWMSRDPRRLMDSRPLECPRAGERVGELTRRQAAVEECIKHYPHLHWERPDLTFRLHIHAFETATHNLGSSASAWASPARTRPYLARRPAARISRSNPAGPTEMIDFVPTTSPGLSSTLTRDRPRRGMSPSASSILIALSTESSPARIAPSLSRTSRY
jgi:hypothetical protein